ncbi:probable G-protein coupled receptor 139 [Rhincodon typus]|uniref:probable G-protein coupled receptor 139 n=1 Tax=Rhincodon typus TaxID=259920 RepID=UPI00202F6452|nr:probable G-protein coupled receptor 139 [Rhincodon typus]
MGQPVENQASHHAVTILEGYAKMINQTIQGQIRDDGEQQNCTLCGIYGMIEQPKEDFRQASQGKVPFQISDKQHEHLFQEKTHTNISHCQLLQLTFNASCRDSLGEALGLVLGIPVIPSDKAGMRPFEVEINLLAIVILYRGKCGVSPCTARYLVVMAAADLMVIITDVVLRRFPYYYYGQCFLDITPVCSVIGVLFRTATTCSVWFTVTFSFDRFVTICCQKLRTKYSTEKTATVVLATTCTLLCLKNIPFYFQYEPRTINNNVPFYCKTKSSYFTETWWVILDWLDTVLTPLLPFALILSFNALTVRHILVTSRVRNCLKGESKGENRRDPEMESRRKSVILLFTISGSFILLWLIFVVNFLYYVIQGMNTADYSPFLYDLSAVGFMLQNLSCCTNTFIYAATLSRFRAEIGYAVKYLVIRFPCIIKNSSV